jgi:hypothetical protein
MAADEADRDAPPRMPRWVKIPAIVIVVLVVLFIGLRVAGFEHGPGQHGPDQHGPGQHGGAPSEVVDDRHPAEGSPG